MKKVELLAPAGNFEKLEIAIHYGADAVYVGGKDFSLRNFSGNFTLEELKEAITFSHNRGVKVYVACNIYARNFEQNAIENYLEKLGEINPDALIIADPGVFMAARRILPQMPIHLSTQANTTNVNAVLFWEKLAVKRVNVARELCLKEIEEISAQSSLEVEAFVHGAMCISYSGRCLLSNFMAKRDSNRGMCCHPCRWKYAVVEETRPGQYFPVVEDDRGTYVFNAKDLCMIEYIPEMIESGISSLKIEGRMKGIHYVASAVKVYREAIESYYEKPTEYRVRNDWMNELARISDRGYCSGFYFGDPEKTVPNYHGYRYATGRTFIGKAIDSNGLKRTMIEVRNKISQRDSIEILSQKGPPRKDSISDILDQSGQSVPYAQPGSIVTIQMESTCLKNDLVRRIDG